MDAAALAFQKRNDWLRRRPPPVRLPLRVGAVVPERLCVLGALLEARSIGVRFQRPPVEGDRPGVEESAFRVVKGLVAVIAFLAAELVVVEDMRAEVEGVRQLFDTHLGTVRSIDGD